MLYGTVLGIHAAAMGTALTLLLASEFLLLLGRRGTRKPVALAFLSSRIAGPLVMIGIVAGIALVFIGGWSLLTPWLVISLILIAMLVVVEAKFVREWQARAQAALRDAATGPGVEAVVGERRALYGRLAMLTIFALVAVLMTMKADVIPFA